MRRNVLVIGGGVIALMGLIFSLQGFGVLKGSSMTNSTFWSAVGPLIVIAGLVLVWNGVRGRSG